MAGNPAVVHEGNQSKKCVHNRMNIFSFIIEYYIILWCIPDKKISE